MRTLMYKLELSIIFLLMLILLGCDVKPKISQKKYICETNDSRYSVGFKRSLELTLNESDFKNGNPQSSKSSNLKFSTYTLSNFCSVSGNALTFSEESCDASDKLRVQFDPISKVLLYMNSGMLVVWECSNAKSD